MSAFHSIDIQQQREWIAGLHAGRRDVFRVVFETYRPLLHHFACLWIPPSGADDVVQDVMFDLWQRREGLDAQAGNLTGYLLTAVRYRVADLRRHQRVVDRVEEAHTDDGSLLPVPAAHAADDTLLVDDLQSLITRTLRGLPEAQRAVLLLRWTQEMTYPEIAQTLGISTNAAMLHASRARKTLSPVLDRLWETIR